MGEHYDVCDECRAGLFNSPARLFCAIVREDGTVYDTPIASGTVGGMMTLAFREAVTSDTPWIESVTRLGEARPYLLVTDWCWYTVVAG